MTKKPDEPSNEELLRRWHKEGDRKARDLVIARNIHFVDFVVRKSVHKFIGDRDDYITVGKIGLIYAVDKFNCDSGSKFTSYAYAAIRNHVKEFSTSQSISFSKEGHNSLATLKYEFDRLRNESNKSTDPRKELERLLSLTGTSKRRFLDLSAALKSHKSMDAPLADAEGADLHDVTSSGNELHDDALSKHQLDAIVRNKISQMDFSEREREILNNRLMADEDDQMTLAEAGEKFGLSRERVRQIETKLITRLKQALAPELTLIEPGSRRQVSQKTDKEEFEELASALHQRPAPGPVRYIKQSLPPEPPKNEEPEKKIVVNRNDTQRVVPLDSNNENTFPSAAAVASKSPVVKKRTLRSAPDAVKTDDVPDMPKNEPPMPTDPADHKQTKDPVEEARAFLSGAGKYLAALHEEKDRIQKRIDVIDGLIVEFGQAVAKHSAHQSAATSTLMPISVPTPTPVKEPARGPVTKRDTESVFDVGRQLSNEDGMADTASGTMPTYAAMVFERIMHAKEPLPMAGISVLVQEKYPDAYKGNICCSISLLYRSGKLGAINGPNRKLYFLPGGSADPANKEAVR